MRLMVSRAICWKSTIGAGGDLAGHHHQAGVDQRLRRDPEHLSWAKMASSTASEIWSATLSGCPSETDSEVNRYSLIRTPCVRSGKLGQDNKSTPKEQSETV